MIVSNGDVGYRGRRPEDRLNMTANNHGSIECVKGQWYVFYHRHTHNSTYSRQACAEPVTIASDGSIAQVECTSCGLNGEPMTPKGIFPAVIACNLTNGHMPHMTNRTGEGEIPHITHEGQGRDAERFITGISAGVRVGYKYFNFHGPVRLTLTLRGEGQGHFDVLTGDELCGEIPVSPAEGWADVSLEFTANGVLPLYLDYHGSGRAELLRLSFS